MKSYDTILSDYDLPAMLWRLNDVCGTSNTLTLEETQEIRHLVERLNKERSKPVKLANVHRITLFHDGHTVEILRRGKVKPSIQRRHTVSYALWLRVMDVCHSDPNIRIYAYHHNATVYRVCEYMPQG